MLWSVTATHGTGVDVNHGVVRCRARVNEPIRRTPGVGCEAQEHWHQGGSSLICPVCPRAQTIPHSCLLTLLYIRTRKRALERRSDGRVRRQCKLFFFSDEHGTWIIPRKRSPTGCHQQLAGLQDRHGELGARADEQPHHLSLTRSDAQNQLRFKTIEQRREQLGVTKHKTPYGNEDDAERSTRAVATGSPPDATEATIAKLLQAVLQQRVTSTLHRRPDDARRCDVQHQIREGTTSRKRDDTASAWEEESARPTRPVQFTEDLTWEERDVQEQLGYAKCHVHREMNIELSQIFVDRKTKSLKGKRETVAKTEDGTPEVPEREVPTNQRQNPRVDALDEVKKLARETARSHHSKNKAYQTCTRKIASNLTPRQGGGSGAYKTSEW